jgi:predicted nucleic acid-binding protein
MIYLDSSAIAKLWRHERESDAMRSWWSTSDETVISSRIALVEVLRLLRRDAAPEDVHAAARRVLASVATVPVDSTLEEAVEIDPVPIRSLDAIHLAAARSLGRALTALCTYDERMAAAARSQGIPVFAPGRAAA